MVRRTQSLRKAQGHARDPAVQLRLKDRDQPALRRLAKDSDRGCDLGRMVGKVVEDAQRAFGGNALQPPRDPVKFGQRTGRSLEPDAKRERHSKSAQCIEQIVAPRNGQRQRSHFLSVQEDGGASGPILNGPQRILIVEAICQGRTARLAQDLDDTRIVAAGHHPALRWQSRQEGREGSSQLGQPAIMIRVIVIEVGQDGM